MIKVMTVFGTRPEGIKMAPVVKALEADEQVTPVTVVTGQHREMLQQVLDIFDVTPDYDLAIMEPNQSLAKITSKVLMGMDDILTTEQPDIVLVHGDTSTTLATSMSAFFHQIPVGHVEAGLRTWQKYSPFPEEMNRQLTDRIADVYFAPMPLSANNLAREGGDADRIYTTGNTAIDALQYTLQQNYHHEVLQQVDADHKMILLTMHRRENQGVPMANVFRAVRDIVAENPDVEVVYPVHLSPAVQKTAREILADVDRVHLIDPLDVVDFHNMAARSYLIMTDSGGVQEEAPSLNVPVLVLRDTTERPEGVDAGTLRLTGTDYDTVKTTVEELLHNEAAYQEMADNLNPYGDGHTADRITRIIKDLIQ